MDSAGIKRQERRNSIAFFLIIGLIVGIPLFSYIKSFSWFSRSLYEREVGKYKPYFKDDFSGYDDESEVLDASSEDLSRWKDMGSITAWLDVTDWKSIDRVDLVLTDASGKSATLTGIENLKIPREDNKLKSDDSFPDYEFQNCDQPLKRWEDFMIVNGRNLLFWEYKADLGIDMSHIVSWKAVDGTHELPLNDVVIQDGLCGSKNALRGVWKTPNGLPMYGVWWPRDGQLIMRNVEQEQYPSNGDHVRITSAVKTPKDFLLRTQFKVTYADHKNTDNTYFRLAWDFDDVFDPGHDETVVYDTFDYGYLGLQRVYPIQRYFTQGFEPETQDQDGKTKLIFEQGKTYELDIQVKGQWARVEAYELNADHYRRVATVDYTFKKQRPELANPFAMETTGNVNVAIDSFEVLVPR